MNTAGWRRRADELRSYSTAARSVMRQSAV